MELELKKECLDVFEAGDRQTLTQEETAETIVPDYCPDIARIISAEGCVYLHGAEPSGTSGTVRVTVLYTPEGESGVRTLEFPCREAIWMTVFMLRRKRKSNCWKAGC